MNMIDDEGDLIKHDYGSGNRPIRTQSEDSVTWFLGDNLVIEDGVASIYIEVNGSDLVRHEVVHMATLVLTDIAPVTGSDESLSIMGDGTINAADAWLAYAVESDILTFADTPLPSTASRLLKASAAQEVIGRTDRVTYLHRDHIDSVVAVTDDSGQIVERTVRYPYGSKRWTSTNAGESVGFTGLRSDSSSPFIWAENRLYDPLLGRWVSTDIEFEVIDPSELESPWETMGVYVYGWNTPLSGRDEKGETWTAEQIRHVRSVIQCLYFSESGGLYAKRALGDSWSRATDALHDAADLDTSVEAASWAMQTIFTHTEQVREIMAASGSTMPIIGFVPDADAANGNYDRFITSVLTSGSTRSKLMISALDHDIDTGNAGVADSEGMAKRGLRDLYRRQRQHTETSSIHSARLDAVIEEGHLDRHDGGPDEGGADASDGDGSESGEDE